MQNNSITSRQSFFAQTREGMFSMTQSTVAKGMLFLSTIVTFLSAGFFYGWQVGPIPGFRFLDDSTYITAMNAVNANIPNTGFSVIFVGSIVFMLITLMLYRKQWQSTKFLLIFSAMLLYVFGLLLITFAVHVPLNEALLLHTDLTVIDVASVRSNYESRWNTWHVYRTSAVVLSAVLLLFAVVLQEKKN